MTKTAIVYNFDENYIEYAATSIYSLSKKYSNGLIDLFCFVTPDMINLENDFIKKIGNPSNIKIKFIYSDKFNNIKKYKSKNINTGHITSHAIQKCFIADVLKDYDKAIYIDPDTLVLEDFEILLDYPMFNKFMAVQEYSDLSQKMFNNRYIPSFNTGVWIADLNYLRKINLVELTMSYLKDKNNPVWLDQEILNTFLIDKWHALPLSFNVFSWTYNDYNWSRFNANPVILHFVGSPKPLEGNDIGNTPWVKKWLDVHEEMLYNYKKENL